MIKKASTFLTATLIVFVLGFFIFKQFNSKILHEEIKNQSPIDSIKIEFISSPFISKKESITVRDTTELEAFRNSLGKDNIPVHVTIAKANSVYAILQVFKKDERFTIEVLKSDFTGWVLVIGTKNYANRYIFDFVDGKMKQLKKNRK